LFLFNFVIISEQHILREELKALQTLNVRLTQKASEVEEELKKTKQELEQIKVNKSDSDVINISIVCYKYKLSFIINRKKIIVLLIHKCFN